MERHTITFRWTGIMLITGIVLLVINSHLRRTVPVDAVELSETVSDATNTQGARSKVGSPRQPVVLHPSKMIQSAGLQDAAKRDGERILQEPNPDFFLTYQLLTNSGVSPDLAKARLRPIIAELFTVTNCERLLASDADSHWNVLDQIRSDSSKPVAERALVMSALCENRALFLQKIAGQRDQCLRKLEDIVRSFEVSDSSLLMRRLTYVTPTMLPPNVTE